MEDNILVKRCQKGDKEAFQELISKYHPYIYKFLIRLTEDREIAEDLTQETFIKVIRNIDKFDVNGKARFSTYLITISKNSYIDYLRKERKYKTTISLEESFDLEDYEVNVENAVIGKIYSQEILNGIEKLSDEQQLVIKMKYIEGLTLKEIGEELDLEPKTVKSRIHNGIVKLRSMLERGGK